MHNPARLDQELRSTGNETLVAARPSTISGCSPGPFQEITSCRTRVKVITVSRRSCTSTRPLGGDIVARGGSLLEAGTVGGLL